MALALNIGKCTLLGNYRENNEDSIDVKQFPDMTVCLVADGMGGQAAGEVASKRAIEIVPRELKTSTASPFAMFRLSASSVCISTIPMRPASMCWWVGMFAKVEFM